MNEISLSIIELMSSVSKPFQYIGVGLFSFAEGVPVIGSILPGGTIALFAGSLASEGLLSPFLIAVIVGVMSFLGDMTGFFVGRKFTKFAWVKRMVENEKHQKTWDLFDRHLALVTIFGKLLPVVRSTPSLFAAIRGVKTRRYMLYSLAGSFLWGFAGVYAGNIATKYFGPVTISIIFGILAVSFGVALVRSGVKWFIKKRKQKAMEDIKNEYDEQV